LARPRRCLRSDCSTSRASFLTRAAPPACSATSTPETIVVLWAPLEIAEQAKSYLDRLPEVKGIYPLAAILRNAASFPRLELSQFDQGATAVQTLVGGRDVQHFHLPISSLQRFETEAKKAIKELNELAQTHDVTVFCENEGREESDSSSCSRPMRRGCRRASMFPSAICIGASFTRRRQDQRPVALLGHHELFHRYEMRRRVKKVIASRPVDSFLDLKDGDYVVHVAHGIARFMGMHTISKDGKTEEYLSLRFAENATLHVPASRINLIQKYIGGFHGHPQLSRLGSDVWSKQKPRSAKRSWTWPPS
jgi:transcription-repair coupling factor (superfamily II helicase)